MTWINYFSGQDSDSSPSTKPGAHFSSRGHSVHDMKVSILEKVHSHDELLREEWESMFIRDFKGDLNKACGAHFSLRGHTVHGMKVSILEKVHSDDELLREERESMFIRDFN